MVRPSRLCLLTLFPFPERSLETSIAQNVPSRRYREIVRFLKNISQHIVSFFSGLHQKFTLWMSCKSFISPCKESRCAVVTDPHLVPHIGPSPRKSHHVGRLWYGTSLFSGIERRIANLNSFLLASHCIQVEHVDQRSFWP